MNKYLSSSLFLTVIALMGIGLVQVYSSSFVYAIETYGDGLYFFKRQLIYAILAFTLMIAVIRIPLDWIERLGGLIWLLAGTLIGLTFVPGIGIKVGGALRWLKIPGGFRVEPSEFLKISFVILVACLISRENNFLSKVKNHWIVLLISLPLFMLLKQPDFGSFAIITMVGLALLFSFGLKWRYILVGMAAIVPAFYLLVMNVPYRKARIMAFLDPWADPAQKGFQVIQSMLSFHSGGLSGAGLGNGQGKLFFLPEAHTDFTLAVFGEELGFVGVFILLSLYGFVALRGIQIAIKTQQVFRRALVLGLTITFALSVFINFGVVMGILPTKGLTLPFLSYGGSSLMMYAILFGLILNVENSQEHNKFAKAMHQTKWMKS